jgi:type II secretory pathway pseudopilin PulG
MMSGHRRRDAVTLIEVLLILVILGGIATMLFPAIQAAREASRRAACVDSLKIIGLAVHKYYDAHKELPPSSDVTRDAEGKITAVDGWSWTVSILPYIDEFTKGRGRPGGCKKLYDDLDVAHGRPLVELAGAGGTPRAAAIATSVPEFLCPSFGGSPYSDPATKTAAVTNYRVMGATHIESLSIKSPNPLTPKYNPPPPPGGDARIVGPLHPDGACFPGIGLRFEEFHDGIANTILAVESVEPRFARWVVGAESAVVGLPRNVEFERYADRYYVPRGLNKAASDGSGVDPVYWTYCTYLDCDCDENPYDGVDGLNWGKYGPSSNHLETANHLFVDGACRRLNKGIDVTTYMALITRAGGEGFP